MTTSDFQSHIKALKAFKKNPGKFDGHKPRPLNYNHRHTYASFKITNQMFKFDRKHQLVIFHKDSKRSLWWRRALHHNLHLGKHSHIKKVQEIEVVPKFEYIELLVNVKVKVPKMMKDNGRYMGIDPNHDNLAVITTNQPGIPNVKISNGNLRHYNHNFFKKRSNIQKELKQKNNRNYSKRMGANDFKHHWRVYQYLHSVGNYIIHRALRFHISVIIIGSGCSRAQNGSDLTKSINQDFCDTPYGKLIRILKYKGEDVGINVIATEESYTSQTSFLDGEQPVKSNGNKARAQQGAELSIRRVVRGLIVTDNGWIVNADVNGSLQIIKKQRPHAFDNLDFKEKLSLCRYPKDVKIKF